MKQNRKEKGKEKKRKKKRTQIDKEIRIGFNSARAAAAVVDVVSNGIHGKVFRDVM